MNQQVVLRGECTWEGKGWGEEYAERHLDEDHQRIDYRDWSPATSRVVSGPLGEHKFPGRSFPDRDAARAHWAARARIIEEHFIQGRWALRIAR